MAIRPVLALPAPVLKQVAQPVGRIDDAARALAADLVDTMRASPACVGLAAPQIGVPLRAFAMDITGHKKAVSCHGEVVLFDPEVLLAHGPDVGREGCMSVPDFTGDVTRATRIVIRGFDADGRDRVIQADAFEARAVQHELDHLDGLLFLDRVSSPHSVFRRKTYR
ncbi:MAG: peptide deformylase [Actinobacteria bacterium]|nr:peptide deformylase [Actinomycetota bacterium]